MLQKMYKRVYRGALCYLILCANAHAAPFAYVVDDVGDTVVVIDIATNTVVGSPIAVGGGPRYVAITPDGKTVYVTNSGVDSVTPIDAATNIPGASIAVG